MKNLEKALVNIDKSSYEITNIEKFSSLYYYLNTIKKKVTELELKVRKKGSELMSDEDIKKIDFKEYEIIRVEPTEIESYNVNSVIDGLGMEKAIAFLKVNASITRYLKKATYSGAVTMEEMARCREKITKKPKFGYIKIQKKKNVEQRL